MKSREFRTLVLAAFMLLFAGLLISGAPRLIACTEEDPVTVCREPVPAILCNESVPSQSAEYGMAVRRTDAVRRFDAALHSVQPVAGLKPQTGADANGNVLCADSYMRSVYQSFALGDGFA